MAFLWIRNFLSKMLNEVKDVQNKLFSKRSGEIEEMSSLSGDRAEILRHCIGYAGQFDQEDSSDF